MPREIVRGTQVCYGGTTIGDGPGPAPVSQTNTQPLWYRPPKQRLWQLNYALDMYPGGATCTPLLVVTDRVPCYSQSPVRGMTTAWLISPNINTNGLNRVGDTTVSNPIGCYINNGAANITSTSYDYTDTVHTYSATFSLDDEFILYVQTWAGGVQTNWANTAPAAGARQTYMSVFQTYGTGNPATTSNTDPIKTWSHNPISQAGGFSPHATYSTVNTNWPATAAFQGKVAGYWCWFNRIFTLADANLFCRELFGMLVN